MKRILISLAILAASTAYGCTARAQCLGGTCPAPQYSTPVRNVVYATAQAVTQATAPKQCQTNERKGLLERIAEHREQRKVQCGGGCCR